MSSTYQIERLARLFDEALRYADKHEIFTVITDTGIEIEGRHAVDLPRTYTIVGTPAIDSEESRVPEPDGGALSSDTNN